MLYKTIFRFKEWLVWRKASPQERQWILYFRAGGKFY